MYKEIFTEIRDFYEKFGDVYRAQAYDRAINDPHSAGKSLKAKIDTIERTGQLPELNEIRKYQKLAGLNGFSMAFVKKVLEKGFPPKDKLTIAQKLSYKYREQICTKIPRKTISKYIKYLRTFPVFAKVRGLGSYRRGKSSSSDVDLIIKTMPQSKFPAIHGILGYYLRGPSKMSWLQSFDGIVFQVDLLKVPVFEYATSLIYFTGSKKFNIIMRQHAKARGFLLNEHGLFRRSGEKVLTKTEKEVFAAIDFPYKSPKDRNI